MNDVHSPSCPPSAASGIAIAVEDSEIRMVRCSGCDEQWWERDGARVPLPELLPLLRESRNAPRAAAPRRSRRPEESPVAAAARAAAAEVAGPAAPAAADDPAPAAAPKLVAPRATARRAAATERATATAAASEAGTRRAAAERARVVDLTDRTEASDPEQEGSLLFRQLLALQERSASR